MKDKIIIYGGSFNPPTIAHQVIAQAAVDYAEIIDAELWLLLSGDRADKSILVPIQKRIDFANGLVASLNTNTVVKVIDLELYKKEQTRTIDTYRYFKYRFPRKQFIWLFGSDSIQTMPSWEEGDFLAKVMNILIVRRLGFDVVIKDNMAILEADTPIISSTEVRHKLKKGESIKGLVPIKIENMLK